MLDQLQGLHIEPTNMCTLKCPLCARTNFIETFPKKWRNQNLNLKHLESFLDIDLQDKNINLCGNYGDPIYYDHLFEMIEFFKSRGCSISLATNGSYRTESWWQQLVDMFSEQDVITFGIDGLPDNYTEYRINSEWESVLMGLKKCVESKAKTVWQFIPFSFNEDITEQVRSFAMELGVDEFLLLPSHRWNADNDELKPKTLFAEKRTTNNILWPQINKTISVEPQCTLHHNYHYISADGFYTPCCYANDYRFYYKTEFYKNKDLYDISKTTITEVLTNLKDFYSTLEDAKLNYCTFNCPKL